MKHPILLVENDSSIVSSLTASLTADGHAVETTTDGSTALELLTSQPFDLVLLDVDLPCWNGLDICRELRLRGIQVPIIMLSAENRALDRIPGLKLGADDYVVMPFDTEELLARVDALIRRWRGRVQGKASEFRLGPAYVNLSSGKVMRNGDCTNLPSKELRLLRYLVSRQGVVVTRNELLREVWGYRIATTRTLDVHIAALRHKIEDTPHCPRYIRTVRGKGYTLTA